MMDVTDFGLGISKHYDCTPYHFSSADDWRLPHKAAAIITPIKARIALLDLSGYRVILREGPDREPFLHDFSNT